MKSLLFLLFFTGYTAFGQAYNRCGTPSLTISKNQAGGSDFEQWIQNLSQGSRPTTDTNILWIPVVFHVIHNGEPLGQGANIPDSRIISQIQILNQDFGRAWGSIGYNQDPAGTDTRIRFVLATQTPSGEPLNSIIRTNGNRAAWYDDQLDTLKNISNQNPDFYLNIWVANLAGGNLGFASWPESNLQGLNTQPQNPNRDGLIIHHQTCGQNISWASAYNLGRTATHEIGHFLGLLHVWGSVSGDCNDTDYCEDTPTSSGPNLGCPTHTPPNSCPNLPGNDMIRNYLNYTSDACMNIFTNDQAARMRLVLQNSPRRATLTSWHPTHNLLAKNNFNSLNNLHLWPTNSQNGLFYLSHLPANAKVSLVDLLGKPYDFSIFQTNNKIHLKVNKKGFYILGITVENQYKIFKIRYI